MRLLDYVKCTTCHWRYGNIFHICIENPSKEINLPPRKGGRRKHMSPRSQEHREALAEATRQRWVRYREHNAPRDAKIVERYLEGTVGIKAIAREFNVSYHIARKAVDEAGVARPPGKNLRHMNTPLQNQ